MPSTAINLRAQIGELGDLQLPIVLASGYVLAPERLQGLALEFIRKPYTLQAVRDAIARAWQWGLETVASADVKLDNHIKKACS